MMVSVTPVDYDPFGGGEVPQAGRALLDTIAGSESPGYNVMYGGGKFEDFTDHPRKAVPITSGPNVGKTSSAAGRYQFLGSTWDEVKKEAGLPDFSPDSQDRGAWYLANKTYKQKTGRDLETDLTNAKGNPNAIAGIGSALSGVWTSLPGGIEPNRATGSFRQRFDQASAPTEVSAAQRRPKVTPVDYDPFAPPSTSTGQDAAGIGSVPPPLPADTGGRFTDTAGENFRTAREGAPVNAGAGEAAKRGFMRGATFNFIDELYGLAAAGGLDPKDENVANAIAALAKGAYKKITGDAEGDAAYRAQVSNQRAQDAQIQEQQPVASVLGEVGGVAATLPFGGGVTRGASTGRQMLQGAKQGAAYGAISGAGEGTDAASRATGALTGGAIGGVIGGAAPPVVAAVTSPFTRSASRVVPPTADELKTAARAGYNSAEVKGLVISPTATRDFAQTTRSALDNDGLDNVVAKGTHDILAKLDNAPSGATVTGQNLDSLRKTLRNAADEVGQNGRPTPNAVAARRAIDALDDFIPNIKPADVLAGDAASAAAKWDWARGNYAAASRSENIDQRVIKAQLRAEASNSGMNIANTIRQRMADIVGNPKLQRGYSADELAKMEEIVRGTKTSNALRFAGNLLGGGGGLGAVAAAGVGGLATSDQGGFGAAAPAVGYALRVISNRRTLKDAGRLSELIRERAPLANAMAALGTKAQAFHTAPGPKTIAAAALAARNLSNNLKDAGVNLSPADIMRSLQGGAQKATADDQQQ